MVPFNVVGILREKLRQREADIAALKAKTQGQAVEIAQLRAALRLPIRCRTRWEWHRVGMCVTPGRAKAGRYLPASLHIARPSLLPAT